MDTKNRTQDERGHRLLALTKALDLFIELRDAAQIAGAAYCDELSAALTAAAQTVEAAVQAEAGVITAAGRAAAQIAGEEYAAALTVAAQTVEAAPSEK